MPKFNITLAYDVPAYAHIEVEAATQEEAEKLALARADTVTFDPEFDSGGEVRVVDTEVVDDVVYDTFDGQYHPVKSESSE